MQFTFFSLFFLFIVLVLFYSLKVETRPYTLAIASIIYPFFLSKEAGVIILIFSSLVYLEGLVLSGCKKFKLARRVFLGLFVGVIAILLLVGKDIFLLINNNTESSHKVLIPIGFSFYAFQAISYLIDIYSDKIQPMRNPIYFHLYMSWFPKFISGPIERAGDFFDELSKISKVRLLSFERLKKAFMYILIGCFYKMVIADRLVVPITQAFNEPQMYSWWILLLAAILYSIQIYCDFAGYSMFVIGISELFGIELIENFNTPYLAANIKDFWNRWHISLSKWLQEYIYIPLGGNRKGTRRKYFNIMCVFIISGIWHGAGGKFIIWGVLHGIYSIVDSFIENKKYLKLRDGVAGRIIVLMEVTFAWIFFRANSTADAIRYIVKMMTNRSNETVGIQLSSVGIYIDKIGVFIFIIILAVFVISEIIIYRIGIKRFIDKLSLLKFLLLVWILFFVVLVLGIYGPDTGAVEMIYMNF